MILTAKASKPTAIRIREALKEKTGKRILVTSRASDILKHDTKVTLRYGLRTPIPHNLDTKFNSVKALNFLSSKESVSIHLLSKGFISPKFITEILPESSDFPLFIRSKLDSFKGQGMTLVENMDEFEKHWKEDFWWCKFIPTSSEFRVHVVRSPKTGEVSILRASKKVLRDEFKKEVKYPIRVNSKYKFSRRFDLDKMAPKLTKEILEASENLPGYFFSWDVGWSKEYNRAVFFETNTASGMDNGAVDQFTDWLIEEKIV